MLRCDDWAATSSASTGGRCRELGRGPAHCFGFSRDHDPSSRVVIPEMFTTRRCLTRFWLLPPSLTSSSTPRNR